MLKLINFSVFFKYTLIMNLMSTTHSQKSSDMVTTVLHHRIGTTLVCWVVNALVCVLMHADTVCVLLVNINTSFIGHDSVCLMCLIVYIF